MEQFVAVASIVASVSAVGCGLVALFRNKKKDDTADGVKDGRIFTELGYIRANTDDIKRKQERQDEQNLKFESRLSSVESSAKSAHRRLDILEGRVNHDEHTS